MMRSDRPIRAVAYGDVDMNLIDGSSVWVASVVELLAKAGCEVDLVLKRPIRSTHLLEPVIDLPGVTVIEPSAGRLPRRGPGPRLTPDRAVKSIVALDRRQRYDLILVRGWRVARRASLETALAGRLWTYLTDIPQSIPEFDPATLAELDGVARASRFLLCQTEDLRSFLESAVEAAVGRTGLLPPVVPALPDVVPREPLGGRPIRLVYAGKFAPLWNTLEMTDLPARLAERGVSATMTMIGDKIQADPSDPTYRDRMDAALNASPGVERLGGRSRAETMKLTARADIGLSWRDRALDASLELSTKVLEYGALGVPVLLNRTPMHERALGADYPLFAVDEGDLLDVVVACRSEPGLLADAAARVGSLAADHTVERGVGRMRVLLNEAFPAPLAGGPADRPLRVGIASHDLKFFSRIVDRYRALPNVEVRLDLWPSLHRQDVAASRRLLDWADVIVCEWCGPNAVWYSRHVRTHQRLIVRLHRAELSGAWLGDVAIDRVDRLVCVSDSYAAMTRALTGWPASRISVVPNWVDDATLDRPKFEGARYSLGFIGMAPARKRLDRALDVLEHLREHEPRFSLSVKSKFPWQYPWVWQHPEERDHTEALMRRIQTSPLLRGSVVFDEFGPDVAAWLRRVGFVLSTSDDESFHLAPAEGMASRAVPAILGWPGADTIYDGRWIHASTDDLADTIAAITSEGRWLAEGELARRQAVASFGIDRVGAAWERLLVSDPAAPSS